MFLTSPRWLQMIWVQLLLSVVLVQSCLADCTCSMPKEKPVKSPLKRFQEHFKDVDPERFFRLQSKLEETAKQEANVVQETPSVESILDPTTTVDKSSLSYINEKAGIDDLLFEGDMMYSNEQMDAIEQSLDSGNNRTKQQALNPQYYGGQWIDRTVYYELSPALTREWSPLKFNLADRIKTSFRIAAKEFWEANTCLTFTESNQAPNRIFVFPEAGCWSMLGMQGGVQKMSLAAGCDRVAKHEIGHAIGLYHSHSRHDRDSFLTVNYQNIRDDKKGQFNKATTFSNENFGIGYDYGSTMQYFASLFQKSSTGPFPMQPKDRFFLYTIGNDKGSFNDILMINRLYQCEQICAQQTNVVACTNGGIPNPKACNRCICPRGYSGITCANPQKDTCGTTIMSTRYATVLKRTVGAALPAYQYYARECTVHLRAPPGKKIEVQIKRIAPAKCHLACRASGIELKARRDPRFRGIMSCCAGDQGKKFVSENHVFPIIFYSVTGVVNFEITYRWVEPTTPSTTTYRVY